MIPVRILGTASRFPGPPITTAEMVERATPGADAARIEAKTGIKSRHFCEPGARTADLAADTLRDAVAAAGIELADLRRVILVHSTAGDVLGPATANAVIHALGIDNRCDCFDLTNACMGFLSAFDTGARAVATGLHPVGIVSAEIASRTLRPDEPRPYFVFGDAAAAAVLGVGRPGEGILGASFGNDGAVSDTAFIAHPLLTRKMEYIQFAVGNREMVRIAVDALRRSAEAVLQQCGETMASVDWVLPHQPNGAMLDLVINLLGVDPAKVVRVVHEIGSVVSASIPSSLDRLFRTRPVKPGDRILMIGVGSGLAYGAVLYRVAPDP
jgi:3-oxoacyl-[acyl-carrier-protein] synthase III